MIRKMRALWRRALCGWGVHAVFAVSLGLPGCTTSAYLADRSRDAADVFTATVGLGAGATARAGPLHMGLFWGRDAYGLRDGVFAYCPLAGAGTAVTFDPLIALPIEFHGAFCYMDVSGQWGYEQLGTDFPTLRGKSYYAIGHVPFLVVPEESSSRRYPRQYLTQIEFCVGVGPGVRLGFNPGELFDFVVGLAGFDPFGDDIGPVKIMSLFDKRMQAALDKAAQDPRDVHTLHWIGVQHLTKTRNLAEAERYFLQVVSVAEFSDSRRQRSLLYLAGIYQGQGKTLLAEQRFREFLETKPDLENDLVLRFYYNDFIKKRSAGR